MDTIEALAHETRGAVTLFCIFWSVLLFPERKRSRMMKLLFISTLWLTFTYLKDAVFLIESVKYSVFADNLVNLTDLVFIPLICSFFIEAANPGSLPNSGIAAAVSVQALFIPAYLVFPNDFLFSGAYAVSLILSIYTVVRVAVSARRYRRLLAENYSCLEHIDVQWVIVACTIFLLFEAIYPIAFHNTSWLSEAIYNVLFMAALSAVFVLARHHIAVHIAYMPEDGEPLADNPDNPDNPDNADSHDRPDISDNSDIPGNSDGTTPEPEDWKDGLIGRKLEKAMEQDRIFLNPELTLRDASTSIGTNMKYLSQYLNHSVGMSFYEYVNRYRVEEACRLINRMYCDGRMNMEEVAQQSGFNSLSSFNRYFKKQTRLTPKEYYQRMR
ncbi:MAG: helix-turn-helix domain-containing protein [Candidatus Cryptobacteroides sp.]